MEPEFLGAKDQGIKYFDRRQTLKLLINGRLQQAHMQYIAFHPIMNTNTPLARNSPRTFSASTDIYLPHQAWNQLLIHPTTQDFRAPVPPRRSEPWNRQNQRDLVALATPYRGPDSPPPLQAFAERRG